MRQEEEEEVKEEKKEPASRNAHLLQQSKVARFSHCSVKVSWSGANMLTFRRSKLVRHNFVRG